MQGTTSLRPAGPTVAPPRATAVLLPASGVDRRRADLAGRDAGLVDLEVGVDAEDIRPIEAGVAERFFSPAELSSMATLEGPGTSAAWLDAFYRCWTRKEAILKAEGMGLRIPLDSFDVSVLAGEPATLLAARPKSRLTANWHLHHLSLADGTIGALAVDNRSAGILEHSLAL